MRSDYIHPELLWAVIDGLTYPNQLAMRIALKTGLRIDDVLSIKKDNFKIRMTVREKKTRKSKRIYFGVELFKELSAFAFHNPSGYFSPYLFPHRTRRNAHRTRQAVYKDVKKVVLLLKLSGNISPHSARKCAAVRELARTGSIYNVMRFLNHERDLVTILYALSDQSVLMERLRSQKPIEPVKKR